MSGDYKVGLHEGYRCAHLQRPLLVPWQGARSSSFVVCLHGYAAQPPSSRCGSTEAADSEPHPEWDWTGCPCLSWQREAHSCACHSATKRWTEWNTMEDMLANIQYTVWLEGTISSFTKTLYCWVWAVFSKVHPVHLTTYVCRTDLL